MKNKTKSTTKDSLLKEFGVSLLQQDHSTLTIKGYISDIQSFFVWFEKHNHEPFTLESVTPIDVREYHEHLQKEQGLKASSVNCKLASIASLMRWARQSNQIHVDPTENVKPVRQSVLAPHWLDKKEQFACSAPSKKICRFPNCAIPNAGLLAAGMHPWRCSCCTPV